MHAGGFFYPPFLKGWLHSERCDIPQSFTENNRLIPDQIDHGRGDHAARSAVHDQLHLVLIFSRRLPAFGRIV